MLHTDKKAPTALEQTLAGQATVEQLTTQLSAEELAKLCVGSTRGEFGNTSVIGAASMACLGVAEGTTSYMLEKRSIPNLILVDNPAGLRLSRSFVADAQGNVVIDKNRRGSTPLTCS